MPIPNVMLNDPILLILIRVIIFNYGDYQSCLKQFLFLKESSIFSFEHAAGEKRDGPDRKAAYHNPISYINTFVPHSHKSNRTQAILITLHNYIKRNKK